MFKMFPNVSTCVRPAKMLFTNKFIYTFGLRISTYVSKEYNSAHNTKFMGFFLVSTFKNHCFFSSYKTSHKMANFNAKK